MVIEHKKYLKGIEFDKFEKNYVDKYGIANLIMALAEISREKAHHIIMNWQDERLAKRWNRVAAILDKAENIAEGL